MTTEPQETEPDRTERRPAQPARERPGAGGLKRIATGVLGGVLLVRGLRRRSLRGIATALLGGWLLSRAVRGSGGLGGTADAGTRALGDLADRTRRAGPPSVSRSTTIGRSPDELYELWRDPDRLSQLVRPVAEVTQPADDRLVWTVHGPRGRDVSWETGIVEDEPGELVRWETAPDEAVSMDGSIRFDPAPGDRGTVATLSIELDPPGGALGTAVLSRLDLVPEALVGEALRRLKSLAETGEIQTLEGNPSGRGIGDLV